MQPRKILLVGNGQPVKPVRLLPRSGCGAEFLWIAAGDGRRNEYMRRAEVQIPCIGSKSKLLFDTTSQLVF